MTKQEETTEWGPIGAKVAVYKPGSDGVSFVLIQRLTKTLIITSDDRRFRRDDGYEARDPGAWVSRDRLCHPQATVVQDRVATGTLRRVVRDISDGVGRMSTREQAVERLRAAHDAVTAAWVKLGCNPADLGGH